MSHPSSVQVDPLNSPHPIPWGWVMAMLASNASGRTSKLHYYRSPALISPDRCYAAYSRIQMQVHPEFFRSHVTSVLFLENLETGDLRAITPASPLADNPFLDSGAELAGRISMVIPVSWSASGDRILAREFESLFCSDLASDYAVVVERTTGTVSTIAPTGVPYTNAVLLGWNEVCPEQVLFRAGMMGEEHWPIWAVGVDGGTVPATETRPVTYGQFNTNVWAGPQVAKG